MPSVARSSHVTHTGSYFRLDALVPWWLFDLTGRMNMTLRTRADDFSCFVTSCARACASQLSPRRLHQQPVCSRNATTAPQLPHATEEKQKGATVCALGASNLH